WLGNAAGLLNRVGLEVGHPKVKQVVAREPGDLELGGRGLRRPVDGLQRPGCGPRDAGSAHAIVGPEVKGAGICRNLLWGSGVPSELRLMRCRELRGMGGPAAG